MTIVGQNIINTIYYLLSTYYVQSTVYRPSHLILTETGKQDSQGLSNLPYVAKL